MEYGTIVDALAIVTAISVYFGLLFIAYRRNDKGYIMNKRNASRVKREIEWVAKAPQKKCSNCLYVGRYGAFDEKFECKCFLFTTKGNAVCKHFTFKED